MQIDILARAMAEKGWDVTYVTNAIKDCQYFNGYKLIPAPKSKNEFKKCLSEINADVYYQRGRKELTYWVGEFCKESGKKYVFATSMDIDCFKYKYSLRDYGIVKKIISIKNKNLDRMTLWGMQQANTVLTQTYFQQKTLKENLGIESTVFYNVHHPPENKRVEFLNENFPTILWLANLKDWKQPEIFLQLVKDMKDIECKFLMAGGIKSRKYQRLIRSAERYNKNFEYLGPASLDLSYSLISNCDVFVNTSKTQEGFPNTFIQAWMRGVPTVSLLVDPDGFIANKKLGIVADNNYMRLKQAIRLLIYDRKLRKEMGENAKKISLDKFCLEQNIETFKALISG